MTTSAFRPLTAVEQVFKDLVWTPAIKLGEVALEGWVPALALPVIKEVDEYVIEQIADYLFNQIVLIVDLTAIKLVNAAHQSAFDTASLHLKIILIEKGVTSPEYQKAKEDAKKALSKFGRFGATV